MYVIGTDLHQFRWARFLAGSSSSMSLLSALYSLDSSTTLVISTLEGALELSSIPGYSTELVDGPKLAHFETGVFQCHATRLSNEVYSQCLDSVVKACCDMFLIHPLSGRVLLGKRNVFPQKDWWFGCGGRMVPGDTIPAGAARLMQRELGIAQDSSFSNRVELIGTYSFLWGMREQEPKDHGTADISVVVAVELIESELSFSMDSKEYASQQWASVDEIISGDFHPALKAVAKDYVKMGILKQLKQLAMLPKSPDVDSRIADLFRDYSASL